MTQFAPDEAEILRLAEAARAALPPPFDSLAAEVRLIVEDWPSDALLDEMDIDDGYELTGIYEGEPLTLRSVESPAPPSSVTLFRRPILDEWSERGNVTLAELVTNVTIHEFAHHFGWSDDEIGRIDAWWE
ncbi:metallopeptidase family protein [Jannaschia pohangensis]|uniref:Predicted Zn-dependent protease, minimal metalloprotease (MMP)-like domain n=1 Tax=Jannaschia pohangensis TaxID=390807 RepID=A0A1I3S2Q9_9RHOB|nr:metallopeptidase family protein [Jannaschia pohangensis]SFJ53163.1 Predicted Zn-dependent protease, minimal metalloprotease (MMP)-like domain [Jannaschia pohangensis]